MTKLKLTVLVTILIGFWSNQLIGIDSKLAFTQNISSLDVKKEDEQRKRCIERHVDASQIEEIRLKKLTQLAHYFGIKTEGKSIEQLKVEIEQAKQANPEKWDMLKKELHDKKIKILEQKSK